MAEQECEAGSSHSLWYVGVVISVIGSVVANFGQNTQKMSQNKNFEKPEEDQVIYWRQPMWW
jgi:hypothetical protein